MTLYVDIPWLLAAQERAIPEDCSVADYSVLVAAVARHKTRIPTMETYPDAAWRAAALLHTIVRLGPLPFRNSLYGVSVATYYLASAGEGIDPPYGALTELVREIRTENLDVFAVAERLRAWRI
ncbi:toxin Doc [Streptomyces altiplanensis]